VSILVLGGCGPDEPPRVQPAPEAQVQAKPQEPLQEIAALDTSQNTKIRVKADKHSMAVVEHYDAELAARGWQKVAAKGPEDRGQRKWQAMSPTTGYSAMFDAVWKDPKTGRTAVLTLWNPASDPDVQQGAFEIE
jgi:hypothetical protein